MSSPSKHLAKILFQRMAALEIDLQDDAAPNESEEMTRRQELVAKVLLSELGISDFVLSNLVLTAMPHVAPGEGPTNRELEEFAGFIKAQLKL